MRDSGFRDGRKRGMKKRVLVTGGAGFIGSNLCKTLLDAGHEVICLDDLSSGAYGNIRALAAHPVFLFVRHDVSEPYDFDVQQIYNLACPASPVHYAKDPVHTIKTCALGMINALELAKKRGARVLQTSTSEIYGNPLVHPQKESYFGNVNPIGPRACYDEGKRLAETLCFDYHRQYGVDIRVVRIFNTYGPHMLQNDGRVISNFIVQALQGMPLTVYGDGSQTRSFCYVDDLVRGLTAHMNNTAGFTGPVNLGNPQEITVLGTAKKILAMTGSAAEIRFCDLPKDDPCKRKPDISLAKSALNWAPTVPLDEGLAKTIAYFQSVLSGE